MRLGFDAGTYNLVVARRKSETEISYKKEVNAFLEVPLENDFTYNMLRSSGVRVIKKDKIAYAVGELATNIAYSLKGLNLKRPMMNGCVNPNEKNAFDVLQAMIHGLIGEIEEDATLYYSVPAESVNIETDADYHQKVLQSIFDSYNFNNKKINAKPINEALALVFAELKDKMYTGFSASFGAGQINVCYAVFSHPITTFSLVNSGDWIDQQAAKVTGESVTVINKEKTKVDLTLPPDGLVDRAIKTQYKIMLEKTLTKLKEKLLSSSDKIKFDQPVDFIIGGGTATPNGFVEMFQEIAKEIQLPIPLAEVRKPADHLYSVAKGALTAAENSCSD